MEHGIPITRTAGRFMVALLALFMLAGLCSGTVRAQDQPDCDDPSTVACIPQAQPPQGAAPAPAAAGSAAAAPNTAAAGPIVAPLCPAPPPVPVSPPPPPYPQPQGAAGAAAATAPYPVPRFCLNDVFSTMNRANLAYARAMRAVDPSLLYPYWSQDALAGLQAQIANLQATGRYMVLHLVTIQVLDQSYSSYGAWVHTSEHWVVDYWDYSGNSYGHSDAWYDNQYYLYRTPGSWTIGTDIVQ